MFQTRRILVPVLAIPALVAFSPAGVQLSFAPSKGLTVTKTIEQTSEMALEEMVTVVNGNEMDQGMDMETAQTTSFVFTDSYAEMASGQPAKLVRKFDKLSDTNVNEMSHPMMGDMDEETASESELEGLTVEFRWDAEGGDYVAKFPEDEEGDEALLEGLAEDVDLRAFLPDGEVDEGESWEVEPSAMRAVLAPGGDLKLEADGGGGMMSSGPQPSMEQILGEMEGKVTATFTGTREVEGTSMAVIKLAIEISSSNDLADFLTEQMANQEMPEGMDFEMDVESMDMEFALEGEGELLWNMKAGILGSLSIEGDSSVTTDMAMTVNAMGQEQAMENSVTLAGSTTIEMTFEVQ